MCLWMFARMHCGCGFVCVPRVSWAHMSCMGILTHALCVPACVRVHILALGASALWWARLCRHDVQYFDVAICQMRFSSAICPFVLEQMLLLVCVSPGLYITKSPSEGVAVGFSSTKRWGKERGLEVRTFLERKVPNSWQASLGGEVGGSQLRSACQCLPALAL